MKITIQDFISQLPACYYSSNHDNITFHAKDFLKDYYQADELISNLLDGDYLNNQAIEYIHEYADSNCPIYTYQLLDWYARNWQIVDNITEEAGVKFSNIPNQITYGYINTLENQLMDFLQEQLKTKEVYS